MPFSSFTNRADGCHIADKDIWQIAELGDYFGDDDAPDGPMTPAAEVPSPGATNLLFGSHSHTDKHSILAAIPSRSIVDRLISKYFTCMDIAPGMSFWLANDISTLTEVVIIHSPTFLKEVRTCCAPFRAPVTQTLSPCHFIQLC